MTTVYCNQAKLSCIADVQLIRSTKHVNVYSSIRVYSVVVGWLCGTLSRASLARAPRLISPPYCDGNNWWLWICPTETGPGGNWAKEPLDNRPEQSATSRFWSGMTTVQENRASISLNSPVCGLNLAHLGRCLPQMDTPLPNHVLHISSCRTMNRFERAASTFTLQPFLSMPRSRVF